MSMPPPGWTKPAQEVEEVFKATGRDLGNSKPPAIPRLSYVTYTPAALGAIHKIGSPIQVYPLYENAFRAHRGQSLKANNEESARLYADFSAVAAKHPSAWNYGKKDSKESIGTLSEQNRMICLPCTFSDQFSAASPHTAEFGR
jgi:hypothetical protein